LRRSHPQSEPLERACSWPDDRTVGEADAKEDVVAFEQAALSAIHLTDLATGSAMQIQHPLAGLNLIRL
jgi:hypothetical protein